MDFIIVNGVECTEEEYPTIRQTESGPYCGQCNRGWRKADGTAKIRHANGDAVRMCYAVAKELEDDQRNEYYADLAYERLFEDRGYWEARGQEDYEARNGVIHPDYYTV